jgi:hypothetical protein
MSWTASGSERADSRTGTVTAGSPAKFTGCVQ